MTDEYLAHPPEGEYATIRLRVRTDHLDKLTTAAATQGISLEQAVNNAIQHYDMTLSGKPGQVLKWEDADKKTRRIYFIPEGGLDRWDHLMLIGLGMMILSGPGLLLSEWFLTSWVVGLGLAWTGWTFTMLAANRS